MELYWGIQKDIQDEKSWRLSVCKTPSSTASDYLLSRKYRQGTTPRLHQLLSANKNAEDYSWTNPRNSLNTEEAVVGMEMKTIRKSRGNVRVV